MKSLYKILSVISCIAILTVLLGKGIAVILAKGLTYTRDNLPDYNGVPYIEVNDNTPEFDSSEYTTEAFESYSPLDSLGRCGTAYALVCIETMPTDERGSISSVTPTGWVQNKYDVSLVSGGYIYNRCHLIGWQLTGENTNKLNLITGTRYLNIDGMLGFEDKVAEYVKDNTGHVLYRVSPVFEDDNLLASGVLIEAFSVDDLGKSVCFFVYCFNVQPGIYINYKTGENSLTVIIIPDEKGTRYIYVLNTKTKKYHNPECSSAKKISDDNISFRAGLKCCPENEEYTACAICKPDINSHLLGNVDDDLTVTVADARLILRCAINLDSFSDIQILCGDTDSDRLITVNDARTVLRIAIGLEF